MAELDHHGDQELVAGALDFAVNIPIQIPPKWLINAITSQAQLWTSYPDMNPARQASAKFLGVDIANVLPISGAVEAFSLIANCLGLLRDK